MESNTFLTFNKSHQELYNVPSVLNPEIIVNRVDVTYNSDHEQVNFFFEQIDALPYIPAHLLFYEVELLRYQWYSKLPENTLKIPIIGTKFWLRYFKNHELIFNGVIVFKSRDEEYFHFLTNQNIPFVKEITMSMPIDKFCIRSSESIGNGVLLGHILLPL